MFKAIQSVRLLLRTVRSLESIASTLSDIRDQYCGTAGNVAVNRDDPGLEGVGISYSDDADTYARELAAAARAQKFGSGTTSPWGV